MYNLDLIQCIRFNITRYIQNIRKKHKCVETAEKHQVTETQKSSFQVVICNIFDFSDLCAGANSAQGIHEKNLFITEGSICLREKVNRVKWGTDSGKQYYRSK